MGQGGLSEGGYGALNIGLHHPGEFGLLESWSGYMLADQIPAIFGPSASVLDYNSPARQVMLVTSVATGWLYWLRAGVGRWPGPKVGDALPLDELPGHDGVPLVVYMAVFMIAGVMLGVMARAVQLDRLTAGLTLAAGTGVWLLVVDLSGVLSHPSVTWASVA